MPPPGHAMNTLTGQPIYTFREEEEGSVAGPEMLKLRPALARLQYKSVFIYQRGRKDTYSERRRSGGQCWWP